MYSQMIVVYYQDSFFPLLVNKTTIHMEIYAIVIFSKPPFTQVIGGFVNKYP